MNQSAIFYTKISNLFIVFLTLPGPKFLSFISSHKTSTSPNSSLVRHGKLRLPLRLLSTASSDQLHVAIFLARPILVEIAEYSAAPSIHLRRRASSRGLRGVRSSGGMLRGQIAAVVGACLRPRAVPDLRLPAALSCPACRFLGSFGSGEGGGSGKGSASGGFVTAPVPENLSSSNRVRCKFALFRGLSSARLSCLTAWHELNDRFQPFGLDPHCLSSTSSSLYFDLIRSFLCTGYAACVFVRSTVSLA